MSKLGSGGLLGDSAALNARRDADEQRPEQVRTRTSRSALGAIVAAPVQQPLAGSGGLPGSSREQHPPGPFNKSARPAL